MTNAKKRYIENGIYHVYNRGVNKQKIFITEKDYKTFVSLLTRYLLPVKDEIARNRYKNYHGRVRLFCFCLMENHYHLLVHQKDIKAMEKFMQSLIIGYTSTVNKRNNRVGHLFQGVYKARLITKTEDLMHVSKYIHLNPQEEGRDPYAYHYSSIRNYLLGKGWDFVDISGVLELFGGSILSYQSFLRV